MAIITDIKDVMIFVSGNGGDLQIKNNDLDTVVGLTNQVFIALFGGNIETITTNNINPQEQKQDYWANSLLKLDYNSNFEKKLRTVALTSGGIVELENAAKDDLKPLEKFAKIDVKGSLIAPGKFQLEVRLTMPNNKSEKVKFIWDNQRNELIEEIEI